MHHIKGYKQFLIASYYETYDVEAFVDSSDK